MSSYHFMSLSLSLSLSIFLVMSCLLINLNRCLKGHKSLGLLFGGVLKIQNKFILVYNSCLCILSSLITISSCWTMGKRGAKHRESQMAQWGFWVNIRNVGLYIMQCMNFAMGYGVGRQHQGREFPVEVWQCSSFCNVARPSGSSSSSVVVVVVVVTT